MNTREKWLISNVQGNVIYNLGFVGKKQQGKNLNAAIQSHNPRSKIVPVDYANAKVLNLCVTNSLVGDVLHLPFADKSCDAVIMGELLEHFYQIDHVLSEVSRVTKKNSKLYITTPNSYEIFRFIKHWLIPFGNKLSSRSNYRGYLADSDHKVFWEPLSLLNLLHYKGFTTTNVTTLSFSIPYLRFINTTSWNIWPLNRFSEYLCIIAQKKVDLQKKYDQVGRISR